ncbi:alpha/beta fold hydrolase [Rhodococcus sp. UNC363MFTsu5.1]|uniref:alpha/beta fold hydrolase n=1 Tax=Rhodococcus sp. UNC363MFTsu5.1 TaxID=1449069 RepID=UPI0004812B56|nr:alpha/beta hydrolase [Rhodococcus sp. UNC363MFTsu5.1]
MPLATINGIQLNYQVKGSGDLVVMIMGTGSPGRVWDLHQVPALLAAGYRVCTFDNRGIAPTDECADGITIEDMVADTAALIEHLGGPAHVIGTSLGARVAQELALSRPELVRKAVFLAAHGRRVALQTALSEGERELDAQGITLPASYRAAITAVLNLSPASLVDQMAAQDWLDIFAFSKAETSRGVRAQQNLDDFGDRLAAYRQITRPCLAIGFADDRLVPPYLAAEVAKAIPGANYVELPDCGHYGYLERPDAVNSAILDFLTG